jgi:penicillin-binding protein activator
MKTPTFITSAFIALCCALLGACSTPLSSPTVGGGGTVRYGDAKATETVTNEFGSTDLQLIAEKMTRSLLESQVTANRPFVTLSAVRNKTSEYIDTKNIMNSIQTALLRSGRVRFTRSIDEMQPGVDELQRQNQSGLYKKSSAAKTGNMQGARYSLEGEITSIVKQNSSVKDVFYKFTLKLYDVEEGTVEWQEEEEIRKTSKR